MPSATIVPNTATIITANQYTGAEYVCARSWRRMATMKPATPTAPAIGTLFCPMKSDMASPMPVVSTLYDPEEESDLGDLRRELLRATGKLRHVVSFRRHGRGRSRR